MAGRLTDKIALITGGGSGIGRACALRFAAEGARVCVADLDLAAASDTVRRLDETAPTSLAVQVDTTDEAAKRGHGQSMRRYVGRDRRPRRRGGSGQSASTRADSDQPHAVLSVPIEQFQRVVDINLYGVLFSNRAAARWMLAHHRRGSIINLGSIMSKIPSPGGAYSVSKAGVWMLTKCLAQELAGEGICVNAIGPGFIETPMTAPLRADAGRSRWAMAMTPKGRFGTPEDVANTALFLASDEAAYFTGEILHPSGGVFVG